MLITLYANISVCVSFVIFCSLFSLFLLMDRIFDDFASQKILYIDKFHQFKTLDIKMGNIKIRNSTLFVTSTMRTSNTSPLSNADTIRLYLYILRIMYTVFGNVCVRD